MINLNVASQIDVRRKEIVVLLCIEEIFLMMGQSFLSPILPKFVQILGVDSNRIGMAIGFAITVFGIARVLMSIPAGKIAAHLGRRFLLVGAPAVVAISALGCAFTTEYWQLIVCRLLQGAGAACFSIASLIVLGEISTPANRGLYISFFWITALVGSSLGPTFGGLIGEYFGYKAVFFCYAALSVMAVIWGYLRIPETSAHKTGSRSKESHKHGGRVDKASLLLSKNFILISLVSLFTMISVAGPQNTLVPLVGYESLSLRESQVGIGLTLIAIMQLILTPFAGKLSDRLGRKILIVIGGVISGLGLLMFTQSNTYLIFLISNMILGLGRGIGSSIPTAYVTDIGLKNNYESTIATFRAISDIGWVVGPFFCGYLMDIAGINLPFYLTTGMLIVVVVMFGLFGKETVVRVPGT